MSLIRRKILHEEIGNSIEDLYKENIDEYLGILADHFIESENYEKGADYSKLSGKKAQKAASFNDAVANGKKRIACLEKFPGTEDIEKKIIDARVTVGLYFNQMSYHAEAKEAVEPIVKLALKHDYKRRLSQIYTIIGTYAFSDQGDYSEGIRYLQDALKIAEESNDFVSLWAASHWIGHALADNCDFESALYHLRNSLRINEAVNILWGISIMKSCIAMTVYNWQGKVDLSYQSSSEGLRLAEQSGDALSKAEAYTSYGACLYFKGFFDEAERHLLKGIIFSEKIDYFPMLGRASWFLGETYFETGEHVKSRQYYNKAKLATEHLGGYPSYMMINKAAIMKAKVMNNEKDIDLRLLYGYEAENKIKLYEGLMAKYISEILLNLDDQYLSKAEEWINKAIEADKRNGIIWHLARDYAFAAELFRRKGNKSNAQKNLSNAIEIFNECSADGWVEKYEKELAALS